MDLHLFIPVILGTARQGRRSELPAQFMRDMVSRHPDVATEIIDARDYRIPATDNSETSPEAKKLAETVERADGFIIVSPEYNHGYPGELKMMLDLLYDAYARKPVGICGVSTGMLGGAQMVEQLRLVVIEFHMVPVREAVYFSRVKELFDEQGIIRDRSYEGRVETLLGVKFNSGHLLIT